MGLVVENNYFGFEEKVYCQKRGTAIGTKFVSGHPNIFIKEWKENFLDSCTSFDLAVSCCFLWYGFKTNRNLKSSYTQSLNSSHETIKFIWEKNYLKIPYHYEMVLLDEGRLVTYVNYKLTDAHQNLNFRSRHPPHVRKGIPYSQPL